jgi:hypothetical protein
MIKSLIKEAFTSNDPKMVAMRSEMFCQAGLPVPQVQHKHMVLMIKDRPRHSIDDIKEGLHVHLLVPFSRFKKLIVGEAILHPSHEVQDFSLEQIPENYVVVTVIWNVPEHEEYEMDHPTLQHIRFLGHAISHEVLWNKDDIEFIPPTLMLTSTPTATPASQPSVARSYPSDDGDGDGEGNGRIDKGRNSPRRTSPHPPSPKSPPQGPTNALGSSEAALGDNMRAASQVATTCPPPPPGDNMTTASQPSPSGPPPSNPPMGMNKGPGATEVALGMKTPPTATSQPGMSTSHCPPPPKKPSGNRAEAVSELPYSIAFKRYGTCFHTSYTQLYNMLLVACLHTPTFLSMFF